MAGAFDPLGQATVPADPALLEGSEQADSQPVHFRLSKIRDSTLYAKQAMLREGVAIDEIAGDLPALLEVALSTVRRWKSATSKP